MIHYRCVNIFYLKNPINLPVPDVFFQVMEKSVHKVAVYDNILLLACMGNRINWNC